MVEAKQIVLEPFNSSVDGQWVTSQPLPKSVPDFGRYPNTNDWRRGDLILVSAVAPGIISRQIVAAQKQGGYDEAHARWHHAAAYAGDEYVCEATIAGVQYQPLFKYVGGHAIRVLRDGTLTQEEGAQIVINMMARLRAWYSFINIAALAVQARGGFWIRPRAPQVHVRGACICSGLYADAYSMVTGRLLLRSTPHGIIMPAALSVSTMLADVPLHWRQLTSA